MTPLDETFIPGGSQKDTDDLSRLLQDIDGSLAGGMQDDARFGSGVPSQMRSSDLDFIQMSGLTRPQPAPVSATPVLSDDLDPTKPLDFYESGVADVDSAMRPRTAFEGAPSQEDDIIVAKPVAFAPIPPAPMATPRPSAPAAPIVPAPAPVAPFEQAAAYTDLLDDTSELAPLPPPRPRESAPTMAGAPSFFPRAQASAPEEDIEDVNEDDLAKAERLLQALEQQPRDQVAEVAARAFREIPVAPTVRMAPVESGVYEQEGEEEEEGEEADAAEGGSDDSLYRRPIPPKNHRRAKKSSKRVGRMIMRWTLWTLLAALTVTAGYYVGWKQLLKPRLTKPEEALSEANTLKSEGKYEEAARMYETFASSNPNHPAEPEALLQAAFALLEMPDVSFDEGQKRRQQALDLFTKFVEQNPGNVKATRVKVQMGILNFKLGHNEESIKLLRDPDLQVKDADSALPALRYLAQAYIKQGDFDAAESALKQAAVLNGNFTSDKDYNELGNLCKKRAELATSNDEKIKFQKMALEHWRYAIRTPAINPSAKSEIQKKIGWMRSEMGAAAPPDDDLSAVPPSMAPLQAAPSTQPDSFVEAAPLAPSETKKAAAPERESKNGKEVPAASAQPAVSNEAAAPSPSAEAAQLQSAPPPAAVPAPAPSNVEKK